LDRTESGTDGYGDPNITWTAYSVEAVTVHPYRDNVSRARDHGTFRQTMYQVTFDYNAQNIEHVEEENRIILFGEQYLIVYYEDWIDFTEAVIRIYMIAEKCIDIVTYS
jgi:hypothetical protein